MRSCLLAECPNHRVQLSFIFLFVRWSPGISFSWKRGCPPMQQQDSSTQLAELVYNLVLQGIILYFESPQIKERPKPRPPTRPMRQGTVTCWAGHAA